MNSLFVIHPYKFGNSWVFDDPAVRLRQEPFISGADTILDVLVEGIPDAESGFRLVFALEPFPGYSARFVWLRPEHNGNWYSWPERGMEGWLCPALLKYFSTPPKEIYIQVAPK